MAALNIPNVVNGHVFISRYDTAGNYFWTNELGIDTFIWSFALSKNLLQQPYLLGQFLETDFDPGISTKNPRRST
ncbi:MAG: hypothetical protein LH473_06600 [Chitinophagales bacterium]|nr:hypothetical protein [Chitinophagales bacterium]